MYSKAKYQDASFIILTGGESKRMGTDKGILEVSNTTFFNQVLKVAHQLSNQVFVSVGNHNQNQYQNSDAIVVTDVVSNKGPMGGIISVLPRITLEWFFIVSVDTPMVTEEMLQELWDTKEGYDAVVFSSDNRIHPLVGLYSRKSQTDWNDAFAKGKLKMTSLVKSFNINVIEVNNDVARRLKNINTPHEYQELIASI